MESAILFFSTASQSPNHLLKFGVRTVTHCSSVRFVGLPSGAVSATVGDPDVKENGNAVYELEFGVGDNKYIRKVGREEGNAAS